MSLLKKNGEKFCPNCGAKAHAKDAYCLKCGYSFVEHHKKLTGKSIKWKNILIAIAILALAYIGIRYLNHKPIIPISWQDAISFKNVTK